MGLLLKILLTLLVILVIWWVVKFRNRVSTQKAAKKLADDAKAASQKASAEKTGVPVELRPCPKCGTFVAVGQPCTCAA